MSTRYKTHEARYILGNPEAVAVFLPREFLGIDFAGMLARVRDKLP